MKKIVLSLSALVLASGLMAQNNRVSLGFESGLPLGDFGDAVGVGLGGTVGFEAPIGPNAAFIFHAGYISFMGKTFESLDPTTFQKISVTTDPTWSVPIQAGIKYYFMENQNGLYGGGLVGVHLFSVIVPEQDPITLTIIQRSETHTYFSAAPEMGYVLGSNFDFSLRYQMIFARTEVPQFDPVTYAFSTESKSVLNSYLGFRVAYMFGHGTPHPTHRMRH